MSNKPPCDCLNWCGDDSRMKTGEREPCDNYKEREARRVKCWGVGRMADNSKAVLVCFDKPLTDDQMRTLHDWLDGRVL